MVGSRGGVVVTYLHFSSRVSKISTALLCGMIFGGITPLAVAQQVISTSSSSVPATAPVPLPDAPSATLPFAATDGEPQTRLVELEGTLRVDNDINPDAFGDHKYNLRTQRFEMQASITIPHLVPEWVAKQLLLVVRSRMEQDVIINGVLNANHLTVADYLKEAYIEFKEVGGLPIAVIIGTMEVSYGQDFPGMIDYQSDASHGMTDPDRGQVKGFTVALDKKLVKIFDKIEMNFFAPDPKLTSGFINHFDGFAFRVSKNLGQYLTTELSILRKGNAFEPSLKPETEVSFGGAYRRGLWTLWGEGIAMNNSQKYPDAPIGATGGASRITGPGQMNVEVTGIKNTLKQYAFGYQLFLNQQWAVGPTVRYTSCAGGADGCFNARGYGQGASLGVSVRYQFGGSSDNKNPTWIGKKAKPTIKKFNFGRFNRTN